MTNFIIVLLFYFILLPKLRKTEPTKHKFIILYYGLILYTILKVLTQRQKQIQKFEPLILAILDQKHHGNLVFMVIWHSHTLKESRRVINTQFLSKNPKKICKNPCERNRLKDNLKWRYLAGTSVKNFCFANFYHSPGS